MIVYLIGVLFIYMNTQTKSGFLTSEFWISLATLVVNILVTLGYLSPNQADDFVKAVATAFAAISTIIVTVFYLYTRMRIKTAQTVSSTSSVPLPAVTQGDTVDPSGLSLAASQGLIVE